MPALNGFRVTALSSYTDASMRDDLRRTLVDMAARGRPGAAIPGPTRRAAPRISSRDGRRASKERVPPGRNRPPRSGWPGRSRVGADGARAAWLILQHDIGNPALLRRCLPLVEQAARDGEIPRADAAHLADRICFFEGRPQIYGTQFDWDDDGKLSPCPISDPESVESPEAGRRSSASGRSYRGKFVATPASRANARQPIAPNGGEKPKKWAYSVGWRQ